MSIIELNKQVCEAVKLDIALCDPSESWNDAMWCAERFGLFSKYEARLSYGMPLDVDKGPGWFVSWSDDTYGALTVHSPALFDHDGPTAICGAIVAIHEAEKMKLSERLN